MGATTIHYEVPKDKYERPYDAYLALVEQEQYNHGYDPYSGTIATCEYYGRINTPSTELEYDEAIESLGKREVVYYEKDGKYVFIGWAAC